MDGFVPQLFFIIFYEYWFDFCLLRGEKKNQSPYCSCLPRVAILELCYILIISALIYSRWKLVVISNSIQPELHKHTLTVDTHTF